MILTAVPRTLAPTSSAPAGTACLYCDSPDLAPWYAGVRDRLGYVLGEREFWRCRRCGSLALVPRPRADELPRFYPPVYSFTLEMGKGSWLKRLLSRAEYYLYFRPQYVSQVRRVMRACGWARGDGRRLLDVGCGRGLRLLQFRRLGFEVHGLDVQPDVVRYLREELNVPAVCADVSEVTRYHPPRSFDLVTTFFLIEHIPDVRGAVAAMYALLKPGGWLAAAVPFIDCVQGRVFGTRWINVREAPRHLSIPTKPGMAAACEDAGFDRVRVIPDSAPNCAGQIASSLLPGASLTHVYGQRGILPVLGRGVGAVVTALSVPWCLFENHVLRRVSLGMVVAHKPE